MARTSLATRHRVREDLADRLENPRGALKAIGGLLVAQAHTAFQEKRLGTFRWPTRYPDMGEPFLNVAAAVGDLLKGRKVKPRRMDREPVLMDTGQLFRSIKDRIVDQFTVEVGAGGPAKSYAGLHQWGGVSTQVITDEAREVLAKQMKALRKARRKPKREKKAVTPAEKVKAGRRRERREAADRFLQALQRLGFIFQESRVETEIHQRPFLGITGETAKKITETVKAFMEGRQSAGGR